MIKFKNNEGKHIITLNDNSEIEFKDEKEKDKFLKKESIKNDNNPKK